jgi:hypothetical protein
MHRHDFALTELPAVVAIITVLVTEMTVNYDSFGGQDLW